MMMMIFRRILWRTTAPTRWIGGGSFDRRWSRGWMIMMMKEEVDGQRQQRYFSVQRPQQQPRSSPPPTELLVSIEEGYREAVTWWTRARQTKLELLTQWRKSGTNDKEEDEERIRRKRCLIESLRRHHFSPMVISSPLEDIVYGKISIRGCCDDDDDDEGRDLMMSRFIMREEEEVDFWMVILTTIIKVI
jgi:hypothetical protein